MNFKGSFPFDFDFKLKIKIIWVYLVPYNLETKSSHSIK